MASNLGRIVQVDLRKAWNHEATDFTNWLAAEENISLLSDEVGIDLKVLQTEASVGKFNVDILAEEENTGRKIIIENQLEVTNHDHLGKIITYASGFDAEIVIWIVKEVRDEHKQAVDWLNEHTDENINFFAIKMELWQIGDSPFAPKFQIISKPNDWAKAIKKSVGQSKMTDTKVMQIEFWDKFIEFCNSNKTNLKLRKARPQHWYDISLGNSIAHLTLTMNTQANFISCEVYISDNKELFDKLFLKKEKIEEELGTSLKWLRLDNKKACRIKKIEEANLEDTEQWDKYFEWMKSSAERFLKVFPKYIKD
jgi:hypothetical protein